MTKETLAVVMGWSEVAVVAVMTIGEARDSGASGAAHCCANGGCRRHTLFRGASVGIADAASVGIVVTVAHR